MNDNVGNFVSFIEKIVILVILVSTITAILFEILKMIDAQYVELADLLLLFIYVEVIGMGKGLYDLKPSSHDLSFIYCHNRSVSTNHSSRKRTLIQSYYSMRLVQLC